MDKKDEGGRKQTNVQVVAPREDTPSAVVAGLEEDLDDRQRRPEFSRHSCVEA